MDKSETLFWILIGAQTVLAIYLGLSKLRLVFACLLAFVAMVVPMIYDIHVWGFPEGGGLIQLLIGGFIPFVVRRIKQRGSLLPRDPKV